MNFKQLPNGMSEGFALLKKCDVKKTKNGAAYLDLVLGDKSDELPAKLWDYTDNGLFAPDMVVKVRGTVEQYNSRDQFRISQIRPAADSDNYNLSDLVPASEVGGAQIYDMLMRRVNAFQDADFKAIVSGIMEDHKEALVRYPAALRLHHAIVGGLMLHTVSIVRPNPCARFTPMWIKSCCSPAPFSTMWPRHGNWRRTTWGWSRAIPPRVN